MRECWSIVPCSPCPHTQYIPCWVKHQTNPSLTTKWVSLQRTGWTLPMPQDLPLAPTAALVFSRHQRSEAGGDVDVAGWLFVHARCGVRIAKSAAWIQKPGNVLRPAVGRCCRGEFTSLVVFVLSSFSFQFLFLFLFYFIGFFFSWAALVHTAVLNQCVRYRGFHWAVARLEPL